MNYKKILFYKENGNLVGLGIRENGLRTKLTLQEAIKEAAILSKNNNENAYEAINSKYKLDRVKTQVYNEKPVKESKFTPKKIIASSVIAAMLLGGAGFALKSFGDSSKKASKTIVTDDVISLDKDAYDKYVNDTAATVTDDVITLDKDAYDKYVNSTSEVTDDVIVLDKGIYDAHVNNVVNENTYEEVANTSVDLGEFETLLNASESETQIKYVTMMSDYIKYFNIDFANTYAEEVDGITVKPALSWNYEIPALTIAYNDLSKNEILQIFNGAELNANTLDANYKNATLQLMGAYVISDSSTPVRLYDLIESEEGKEFDKKYENLFYAIKDATTDEEKIDALNAFFEELYKDYPIANETREIGISHMDARALMDNASFKQSVIPKVAAIEIMYQNLLRDVTLSDDAIAYFNDLGMCNIAYEKFQKVEFVLEDTKLNEKYADFGQLSKIIIEKLKANDAYVIDDQHRDLTRLTRFQELVNGHFEVDENGQYTGYYIVGGGSKTTTTVKRIKVSEWTEKKVTKKKETKKTKTSDREEAVKHAGEKKVKEAEDKVKKEIEEENEKAKEKAEKEAEEKQKELQDKENEKAKEKEKEAEEANKQVQEDIKDINDKINENNKDNDHSNDTKINEKDYSGIDFDDNHSDSQGNLDNSVKDVTTDSTGANKPLPNPEDTGKSFDQKAESKSSSNSSSSSSSSSSESKSETKTETKSEPKAEVKTETKSEPKAEVKEEPKAESKPESKPDLPDPQETGAEFDKKANDILSQEEMVNLYIERIAKMKNITPAKVKVLKR